MSKSTLKYLQLDVDFGIESKPDQNTTSKSIGPLSHKDVGGGIEPKQMFVFGRVSTNAKAIYHDFMPDSGFFPRVYCLLTNKKLLEYLSHYCIPPPLSFVDTNTASSEAQAAQSACDDLRDKPEARKNEACRSSAK